MFEEGALVRLAAAVGGYAAGTAAVVVRVIDRDVCEIRIAGSRVTMLVLRAVLVAAPRE
jgi:hypothetical protein